MRLKFFQKIIKILLLIRLKFHSDHTLGRLCDKVQELLCEICIIFLVGLRFFFLFGLVLLYYFPYFFKMFSPIINMIIFRIIFLCACMKIDHTYWFFIELTLIYQISSIFMVFYLIFLVHDSL
jgi:hypothetical protein